jgi:D-arabinose 1-dehydrogenase-like Zn-dependent alcohol dehydrogenase
MGPEWFQEDLGTLLKLLAQGKIKPDIGERISPGEAARAH